MNASRCEGHPADESSPMGETQYCDGSCQPQPAKPKKYQVILRLYASVIVEADDQAEAEARAEAISVRCSGATLKVIASGEKHQISISEGEVEDVDGFASNEGAL